MKPLCLHMLQRKGGILKETVGAGPELAVAPPPHSAAGNPSVPGCADRFPTRSVSPLGVPWKVRCRGCVFFCDQWSYCQLVLAYWPPLWTGSCSWSHEPSYHLGACTEALLLLLSQVWCPSTLWIHSCESKKAQLYETSYAWKQCSSHRAADWASSQLVLVELTQVWLKSELHSILTDKRRFSSSQVNMGCDHGRSILEKSSGSCLGLIVPMSKMRPKNSIHSIIHGFNISNSGPAVCEVRVV